MRFLVDEGTGPAVAHWLREQGHEVFSVYDEARGATDSALRLKADDENWIVITSDRAFGEQLRREQRPYRSTILLQLHDERPANKIRVLQQLLELYAAQLHNLFVTVTEKEVCFRSR